MTDIEAKVINLYNEGYKVERLSTLLRIHKNKAYKILDEYKIPHGATKPQRDKVATDLKGKLEVGDRIVIIKVDAASKEKTKHKATVIWMNSREVLVMMDAGYRTSYFWDDLGRVFDKKI